MEDAESQNIQRIAQSKVQRTLTPPPQTRRHSIALAHYIRITSLTKIDLIFLQKSLVIRYNDISFKLHLYHKIEKLSCGVIGNTSDSGSEESRFEPWSDNLKKSLASAGLFHFYPKCTKLVPKPALFFRFPKYENQRLDGIGNQDNKLV